MRRGGAVWRCTCERPRSGGAPTSHKKKQEGALRADIMLLPRSRAQPSTANNVWVSFTQQCATIGPRQLAMEDDASPLGRKGLLPKGFNNKRTRRVLIWACLLVPAACVWYFGFFSEKEGGSSPSPAPGAPAVPAVSLAGVYTRPLLSSTYAILVNAPLCVQFLTSYDHLATEGTQGMPLKVLMLS